MKWWEHRAFNAALVGVALLGLVMLLWPRGWGSTGRAGSRSTHFVCSGTVQGADPENAVLIVDFPEVPYQQAVRWKDVSHPRPQSFAIPVDFRFFAPPKNYRLRLRKPGMPEFCSPLLPVPADGLEADEVQVVLKP